MRFASPCNSLRRRFVRSSNQPEKLLQRATAAIVEEMEQRRLLSGTVTAIVLTGGMLNVSGSTGDDVIAVSTKDSGSTIAVYSGTAQIAGFPASSINGIVVNGNDGNDTVTTTPPKPTTVNGGDGNDTITGSAGNDTIKGDAGNDSLTGALGNDDIEGGTGDDILDGSAGNDTVQGFQGADLLSGGTGTDTVDYSERNTTSYTLPGVTITIDDAFDDGAANEGDDVALNIENVIGTAQNDTITASGYNNWIDASNGSDTVYATGGNDTILGQNGWDLLDGGSGNDVIDGGSASDTVYGQGGDDLITETEDATAQGDNILSGGSGDDTITGGNHHDAIDGNSGDDLLNGLDGNDTLTGGSGNDTINGGNGDDYINAVADGSLYIDSVSGGAGTDEAHVDLVLDLWSLDIENLVFDL
jgi:Ca2+-binding RTX toxin-like protein